MSSSGHLALGRHFLDIHQTGVLFEVTVHAATLTATLLYYRHTVANMVRQLVAAARELRHPVDSRPLRERHPDAWLALLIVLASVPTAVLGLTMRGPVKAAFGEPRVVLVALAATGCLLLLTRWARQGRRDVTPLVALLLGLVQGIAIIPGVSRSGATIGVALLLGIDRELAARFSFLLAVPAILGALVLELFSAGVDGLTVAAPVLAVGFVAAAVTGVLALAVFVPLVRRGRLSYFAAYLLPASVIGWVLL